MAIYIFYDSFSKMYLIYSTLYYVITILSTATSYVLISANLDDFKSIASRFIPDEVAGVADVILERVKDAFINDHLENQAVFRHKNSHQITMTKFGKRNGPPESNRPNTKRNNVKNVTKEPVHFKIDIDQFVENIKKKLHTELAKLSPKDFKETKKTVFKLRKQKNDTIEKNVLHNLIKHKTKFTKQHKNEVTHTITTRSNYHEQRTNITQEQRRKKKTIDKRYLPEIFTAKPPKHFLEYGNPESTVTTRKSNNTMSGVGTKYRKLNMTRQKSKYLEVFTSANKRQNNKYDRIERYDDEKENKPSYKLNSKYLDTVTENTKTSKFTDLYLGYDLGNTNDSYDDYVTPKRDYDYKEPIVEIVSAESEKKEKEFSQLRQGPIIKDTKIIDVFSDIDKISIKTDDGVHYEDVTLNAPDENDKKTIYEPIIHPYVEQFEAEINNMNVAETSVATTENVPEKPILVNIRNAKNKKGSNKQATLIPKRDFYKISSPNYLLKAPIIGEKYHFDEPIPEEDRDPENLKYIGNPPASINGKVVFSA